MNKPLDITARQVTALAKGAVKGGCVAVVQIGNTLVKLVPTALAIPPQVKEVDAPEEDFELVKGSK